MCADCQVPIADWRERIQQYIEYWPEHARNLFIFVFCSVATSSLRNCSRRKSAFIHFLPATAEPRSVCVAHLAIFPTCTVNLRTIRAHQCEEAIVQRRDNQFDSICIVCAVAALRSPLTQRRNFVHVSPYTEIIIDFQNGKSVSGELRRKVREMCCDWCRIWLTYCFTFYAIGFSINFVSSCGCNPSRQFFAAHSHCVRSYLFSALRSTFQTLWNFFSSFSFVFFYFLWFYFMICMKWILYRKSMHHLPRKRTRNV